MLKEQRTEQQTIIRQVEEHGCEECGCTLYIKMDGVQPHSYRETRLRVIIHPYGVSEAVYEELAVPRATELCSTCMYKKYKQAVELLCSLGLKKVTS